MLFTIELGNQLCNIIWWLTGLLYLIYCFKSIASDILYLICSIRSTCRLFDLIYCIRYFIWFFKIWSLLSYLFDLIHCIWSIVSDPSYLIHCIWSILSDLFNLICFINYDLLHLIYLSDLFYMIYCIWPIWSDLKVRWPTFIYVHLRFNYVPLQTSDVAFLL